MGGASAQRDELAEDAAYEGLAATGTDGVTAAAGSAAALRRVASERLAEHRRRRAQADAAQGALEAEAAARQAQRRGGAREVREAVAARYQASVSYHEFLEGEAQRALLQAQAEAEIAARNAAAVAQAQMQLLEELEQWKQTEPTPRDVLKGETTAKARGDFASALADIVEAATEAMHLTPRIEMAATADDAPAPADSAPVSGGGLTVRLYEDLGTAASGTRLSPPRFSATFAEAAAGSKAKNDQRLQSGPGHSVMGNSVTDDSDLDEEIAFRLAPEFEERAAGPVSTSGNVIEFPRQLVAARKARPRIAEGPLLDTAPAEPQLRIFEVEPEQVQAEFAAAAATGAPEWQSILLEHTAATPAAREQVSAQPQYALAPQTAALSLRLMAAAVDGCAIAAAATAFVCAVAELGGTGLRDLPLPLAGAGGAGVLAVLYVAYQMLFFTLSEATPGMRYARIALCTFGDTNPSRKAMRRRVVATLLAASPLGLGIAWAWMDEDGLGWHDRISRMYQRAY